ncbi:HNH endonuclease, partial [Pseudomonas aeruginosa]|uniref:HNH endonuclease n=1 Tax=Pseudomonas aeruginosa TaxID=287 RepID=UPI0035244B38
SCSWCLQFSATVSLMSRLHKISDTLRTEGSLSTYYGVRYERDPTLRLQAIAIHGVACKACGFDFGKAYGEYAKGFIHVHHTQPISEFEAPKAVNPETDLVPLCANCHAVVHRRRDRTL